MTITFLHLLIKQVLAVLISFDVSMDYVWMLPRPAIASPMSVVITVMRASVHVSDPWGTGEGYHVEGKGMIGGRGGGA